MDSARINITAPASVSVGGAPASPVPRPAQSAASLYPPLATPEYAALAAAADFRDPVFRQLAPSDEELAGTGAEDPMGEEQFEAVPGLLHRYPDRALLLVTSACFVHCRHCMRKRQWDRGPATPAPETVRAWRSYLARDPRVTEIILSGGDPLTLSDAELGGLLKSLRSLRPRRALRVHTRALVAAPGRVTRRLAAILRAGGVARVVTQFNHPAELSPAALEAAAILRDARVAVANQAVLLRGVNDDPRVLSALFEGLWAAGIRPYYLHHPDPVRGAMHFGMSIDDGLRVWRELRALHRGPLPEYVVDLPGRAGKQPVESLRGPR